MRHIGSFESREEALNYSVGPEKETKIYKEAFRVSGVHAYGDQAADVNRFAHMFLTDAEIDGKKYLVVTELQSDWAQKGRKEGYAPSEQELKPLVDEKNQLNSELIQNQVWLKEAEKKENELNAKALEIAPIKFQLLHPSGRVPGETVDSSAEARTELMNKVIAENPDLKALPNIRRVADTDTLPDEIQKEFEKNYRKRIGFQGEIHELKKKIQAVEDKIIEARTGAPPFPFPKTWHEVALKKALRMAADQGYDGLAVVNGDMVKDRYDLSKHLSEIRYEQKSNGNYHITAKDTEGQHVAERVGLPAEITPDKLTDYFGKDIAEKIVNGEGRQISSSSPGSSSGYRKLEGLDLKMGGEWSNRFYDQTVPQFLGKYGKQWGARVGEGELPTNKFDRAEYVGPTPNRAEIDALMAYNSPLTASTRLQLKKVRQYLEEGKSFKDAMEYHGSPALAEEFGGKLELINGAEPLHTLPFTPEMLVGVKQPQPMFKPKEEPSEEETGSRGVQQTDSEHQGTQRHQVRPEDDRKAGREIRDLRSWAEKSIAGDEQRAWQNIGEADRKPAVAGEIEKHAKESGVDRVIWVKNAGFAGAIIKRGGEIQMILDQDPNEDHLQIYRHEIFHFRVDQGDQKAMELVNLVDQESPAFKDYRDGYHQGFADYGLTFPDHIIAEELAADWYSGVRHIYGANLADAFTNRGKAIVLRYRLKHFGGQEIKYRPQKTPEDTDRH